MLIVVGGGAHASYLLAELDAIAFLGATNDTTSRASTKKSFKANQEIFSFNALQGLALIQHLGSYLTRD